jgi:hypothetical protein
MVIILGTVFRGWLVFLPCDGPLSQLGRVVSPSSLRLLFFPLVALRSASTKLFRTRRLLLLLPFKLV